jgi:DNA-binding beta-propeller fold protein YncE
MLKARAIRTIVGIVVILAAGAVAQRSDKPANAAPLVLTGAIPLPNVYGRIDHFGFDPENRLFLSALGNNTVEVIGLSAQRVVHTINDVPTPQGVVYSPETNKLFVGSDKGKLYIYDALSFHLITTIEFGDDVDNLRYDAANKRVYAGFGDGDTAAIAMIDAATNQRLPQEFKVGAHPESFQLEQSGPNIYVNVPDRKQIAVINRKTGAITRWSLNVGGNFPMALDEAGHRLFVASRSPARMLAFDTDTGRVVAELPCVQDSDDLYYDASRKRIYATGGEGYISVFQEKDPDHFELLVKIPSAVGARTSAYFGKLGKKAFDRLYVAVPARAKRGAEVWIYTVQD